MTTQQLPAPRACTDTLDIECSAASIITIYNKWCNSDTSKASDWYVSQDQVNDLGTMRPTYKFRFQIQSFGKHVFYIEDYRSGIALHDHYTFNSVANLEKNLNMIGFK